MSIVNEKKVRNFKDIFPILTIDSDVDPKTDIIVSKNGDISIGFKIELPEVFSLSVESYAQINESWVKAIKVLPIGYILHKQDWFVADTYQFDPSNERYRSMDNIGIANEQHFSERPFLNQTCYLFITKPSAEVRKRTSLNSSILKRHIVPKEVTDTKMWFVFIDLIKQFSSILNNSKHLGISQLKYKDLVGEFDNSGKATKSGYYQKYTSLSLDDHTLSDMELGVKGGSFKVGNNYTYTYSISELQDFPQQIVTDLVYQPYSSDAHTMPLSFGSPLGIMLPFNHIFNQIIVIENSDDYSNRLSAENKRHQSFAAVSKENEASILFKDAFLTEMRLHGRRPVLANFNILVWEKDPEIADDYRSQTAAALTDLGFIPRQSMYDAETIYWACMGGNASEIGIDNLATLFLEEAVAMMSFEENYKNASVSPYGIRLLDRFGKPVMLDPFIEAMEKGTIANRNFVIVGPSGSGKSFMTNNMVYYQLQAGFHVSIVDVGKSYKRLCEVMGGRYITYEHDNPLSFNPFYVKDFTLDGEFESSIAALLIALWKADNEQVSKSEETTVSIMVNEYYNMLRGTNNYQGFPCFDEFFDFVKDKFNDIFEKLGGREKEFDIKNFTYVLAQYYGNNQYGFLLNSRTNIDLVDLPFIVYELDNIKDHPVLFPVVTIMIMTTYVRKLFTVKGSNLIKTLIIEEAWKALSKPKFAEFLKWASKTVRKHNGALGVVTQEVDDLIGNEVVKDAIINNSAIKFLLDQKQYANRFSDIAQIFGLSDNDSMQVLSVNQKLDQDRPPYREMCVLMGDQTKVYGVEVSKTFYATFTTDKSEVEKIEKLGEQYKDIKIGIKAFARGERPKKLA